MTQKAPTRHIATGNAPKVQVHTGLTRLADGRLVSREGVIRSRDLARTVERYTIGLDPSPPQTGVQRGVRKDHDIVHTDPVQGSFASEVTLIETKQSATNDVDVVLVDLELPSQGLDYVQAVKKFAEQLPVILITAQRDQFEQRARSLLQAFPMPDPLGDAHLANYRDELLARQRYLQTVPCFTSKDVADAARHVNTNASSTAHRWKKEGKIFSIPAAAKRDVYPAFQFKKGKPRELIADLLKILMPSRTAWEIAQWFIAPNSWLDNDRPIDLLDDRETQDLLIDAAEQEVATNVG